MKKTYRSLSFVAIILMLVMSFGIFTSAEGKVYEGSVRVTISEPGKLYGSQNSVSAYGRAVFNGCFGNQLSRYAKEFYNELVKQYVTNGKSAEFTYTFKNPITFDAKVSGGYIVENESFLDALDELNIVTQSSMDAFAADHPEIFWLYSAEFSCSYRAYSDSNGDYTGYIESLTVIPEMIYANANSKQSLYNEIADDCAEAVYDSSSRYNTVKNIHDFICDEAWYYLSNYNAVHTSEPFFLDDGGMVCEGYAKTFKVLCDRLSIPCVLVRGYADGPHMWNYVQMEDGKWYLVDVTWDDQETDIYYTYFLANSESKGFSGKKISEERTVYTDFSDTGVFSFIYPVLSSTVYTKHVHSWESEYTVDVAPTCTEDGSRSIHCKTCDATKDQKTIDAQGHGYEAVVSAAATTAKDGKLVYICECGDVNATESIAKVTSFTLSTANYVYNGKNKTPTVTVKDVNGKKLTKNVDYKLSVASKRSGIGRYTVKVTLIGKYSGEKKLYFYIRPGKTDSVKSASQTTSSVKLSWNEVPSAAGYTVYRYSPSKKAYVKAGTTEGTTLTVKSLYAGTKYTFKVVSYGKTSAGKVYDSDSYALLKTATKTKTPELTKVTASSTLGKAYVYHSDVSGETGYTVYYSTKKDSGFTKYANFKADTTRCDITGLANGKTYYFKVRTYIKTDSGYVYSAWSAVKSVKTASALATPSITVTQSGASAVAVKWKDISGENGYQVWYSTAKDGTYKRFGNAAANATSLTVTGLEAGKTYYFKVRAYKTTDSGYVYSSYSSVKSVKIAAAKADYSAVLKECKNAVKYDFDSEYAGVTEKYFNWSWLGYHDSDIFYAYYDVNSDGVDELLIGIESWRYDYERDESYRVKEIINIFTYKNKPVSLFDRDSCFGERLYLNIYKNGIIFIDGFSDMHTFWNAYKLPSGSSTVSFLDGYEMLYNYYKNEPFYYFDGDDYYFCNSSMVYYDSEFDWYLHYHQVDNSEYFDRSDYVRCVKESYYEERLEYYTDSALISPNWKKVTV